MEFGPSDLKVKLTQLENELKEGDITEKGYQKRLTLLLSQYEAPSLDTGTLLRQSLDTNTSLSNKRRSSISFAASAAQTGEFNVSYNAGAQHSSHTNHKPDLLNGNGYFERKYSKPSQIDLPSQLRPGIQSSLHRKSICYESILNSPNPDEEENAEPTMTLKSSAWGNNYLSNPETQAKSDDYNDRAATILGDVQQYYFSDFTGQQGQYDNGPVNSYGGGPQRYSSSDLCSPVTFAMPPVPNSGEVSPIGTHEYYPPLEPREVSFDVYDPRDGNILMSKFDNMAAILRYRGQKYAKSLAYWVLDAKGKEISSITWEKLANRAEKVAQVIRDKSSLYRGDRVALFYRDVEVIDFAVALHGCFIAGVVAVPINDLDDFSKLNLILTSTQAHLVLTTDSNLKTFQRDITSQKLNWPRSVEWWKTNEFGSFHSKKRDDVPSLAVPDLAYIEFSRSPTGNLRGVVLSHRTIMHQMACLSAMISSVPSEVEGENSGADNRHKNGKFLVNPDNKGEILMTYLDPRQGIGMILGVLLTIYGGHTTVFLESKAVEIPGLYAHLITKYRATLMVADYPGLKRAAYNYQQDPMTTRNFKKGMEPNFQRVKLCLIDTLIVDCDFHEVLADRWLRPMRNPRARQLVAPMLCLPEHGGMVISTRDWLGGEERMGCPISSQDNPETVTTNLNSSNLIKDQEIDIGFASLIGGGNSRPTEKHGRAELSEVLLDREALKTNEVVVVATGEEARNKTSNDANTIRIGAFGLPLPDATLALVDPESGILASPHSIGEIWVDSPSLSGGFWALPKQTDQIFHARPYKFEKGDPTPKIVSPEFLRTGLLGTVIEGRVYVLGLYEDRIRQKVEWVEHGYENAEHRYFFVQHIIVSIMKSVPKIYDCTAFDVFVNEEHLPIVLLETQYASTAPVASGGAPRQLDTALLDSLSEKCMEILIQEHHLRVYCVMITAPNSLPRITKNGRKEIGNMLCRREFDLGNLPCVHVKFGVERAVLNLPLGIDPIGGIWSPIASQTREDLLSPSEKQYSGIDRREVVIDDRTSTPLNNFSSIIDLMQWRVARQSEELAYCTIDGRGKEGKGISWKKLDTRVAAVAMYLQNKVKISSGDHVILMYTHSEEFVFAVHACFCLGVTTMPMAPLDQNRLNEDVPAFLHMVADFGVRAVLVNQDVDHLMKQKFVSQHIKQSAQVLKVSVPYFYNTSKLPKQSSGCRDLGLNMQPPWIQPNYPALVWTYWTPDQRRIAVQLGHPHIMGMCKVQKETCQMTSSRPILGCVRSTSGLGFVHTCLMGIFVGAPTYLLSPVEFAQNPVSLFMTLSRYKMKDTYATSQMLDHAMAGMQGKGFTLYELKNMMISTEGRPRVDVFQKVRLHFAPAGLDRTAINTIYSHVLNPMIASRSYMCIEPIELWIDTKALRRGLIYPVDPEGNMKSLMLQDSGMVPVSTQIAIVNPESRTLCHEGEYGEIWVESEACVKDFYGSKDRIDTDRFNGRTLDGDPNIQYIRTGDLGFLHNIVRPIGPNGAQVDMQVLFVLGNIGETFEVNGLSHFPIDIEYSVERCHNSILPGGCAVFQAGGLIVLLVEVGRKSYLASIVPVIVNAILNEHQIVIDIIAFVKKGDFPRSRLGEKQRGKILASWVTRKLQTMAQFGIRDPESGLSDVTEIHEPRSRIASPTNASTRASSLQNFEAASPSSERGFRLQKTKSQLNFVSLPLGISEMSAENYEIAPILSPTQGTFVHTNSNETSTDIQYHKSEYKSKEQNTDENFGGILTHELPGSEAKTLPNKPIAQKESKTRQTLPGVDGRDLWTLPSQQTLRDVQKDVNILNYEDDESWKDDAIMHMNLVD
ncbi:putative acyl- ligase [Erysiphe necator]|uniref:Putative acyl-ligase n=1 Tax=Uncinula necator TaxID=52586 RepID=A0A0B1PG69_UNCNE|nr:putative acyl- ligase [Erysiphe necator]